MDIHVRDTEIGPASVADVSKFCEKWHYTGRAGSAFWRYGLYYRGELIGVVAYNMPARSVCSSVFGPKYVDTVRHMGRLVLAEDAPRNSESRLIAGSLKQFKRDHPHVTAVLTYAATDAGHIGYVYQATNAIYTGTGGDGHYFLDELGHRRSTKTKVAGVNRRLTKQEALDRGWTVHKSLPKHRYLYLLGSKTERAGLLRSLRYKALPYPKEAQ